MKFVTEQATKETSCCYIHVCLRIFYGRVFGFKGDIKNIEPDVVTEMYNMAMKVLERKAE